MRVLKSANNSNCKSQKIQLLCSDVLDDAISLWYMCQNMYLLIKPCSSVKLNSVNFLCLHN